MKNSKLALRAAWLTARRAGWRRSLRRINRRLRLRLLNPRLGQRLYSAPTFLDPQPQRWACNSKPIEALTHLVQLRQTAPHAHAWDAQANTLTLLNHPPVSLQAPVAWQSRPIDDPLWTFQLHGWEWAWSALNDTTKRDAVLALWRDWLDQITIGQGLAWEPYPTSRRLAVWLTAWHLLEGDNQLLSAIAQQADYLRRHLERDLDNNHLIANAKALAWTGLLLPNLPQADSWRRLGLKWLWRSLQEQIRPDGGHFENSSSYHLAVWLDGLETALLCAACGEAVPTAVTDVLHRMGEFAWALHRPDGRLPLLNDSIEDEPLPASTLFALAARVLQREDFAPPTPDRMRSQIKFDRETHPQRLDRYPKSKVKNGQAHSGASQRKLSIQTFADTGYVVARYPTEKDETYLLFDAGDLGPLHCPGHGHADTLSFELWSQGEALIVDPGTYQYPAGEWRDYFRSTAVHNTATVDDLNQSTFAGPFRLADMAQGRLLPVATDQEKPEIIGEHNGYAFLDDPVIHRRHIRFHHARQLTITDRFLGAQEHQIALHYHLAPSQTVLERENVIKAVYPGGTRLKLQISNSSVVGNIKIINGWISRTWYSKEPSPIVVFTAKVKLPIAITSQLTISSEERSNG
ncbi:MAG: hypothetical protein GY803_21950 [Chloroflexi bacterium]|nr:hypothetical protein [Chloroflexota bacterium]